ncbi:hypothetical protein [Alienimonas chondri]|uniref:Uncharacterized protein n=1 Tax=Alienimonas chondri TaxID=2681879 RepID=A0ABX1VG33_9PLAN|nr:hypothetical protein [Alienimonas chondri]NNJ26797.1 hypothetical protein [Alienimonas chondri]
MFPTSPSSRSTPPGGLSANRRPGTAWIAAAFVLSAAPFAVAQDAPAPEVYEAGEALPYLGEAPAPSPYAGPVEGPTYDVSTPLPARPGDAEIPGFEEPPEFGEARVPGPPRPGIESPPGTPFFADSEYGARPTLGEPCSPSAGLPHRMEQSNRYGIWFLPKSFNAPNRAVYRPSPFRPRGFGNLFDRPCVTERIDYTPYTVEDLPSRYGPTYYPHFRQNNECLVRPTRHYDKGPHAENATGGCRLGSDCLTPVGHADCPGCRPAGFLKAAHAAPAACQCEACRARH